VDNAHEFEWKNVYNEGEYSGYWSCSAEQAFSQPVDNAVQALGISTTMNIIIETLEKFYNIHNDGESKESVNLKFSNLKDFLVDVDDDEDYYDDYDEDDYGYDDDYDGFYGEDDEDEDDEEYKVYISANSTLSLYEWITSNDIKSNDVTELIEESKDEDEEVSDKEMVNHPP